ncbi:NAD(P)H-binding protein [Pseudonocardia sp. Ae505_Ps2]|uniref:NAD(P)H-binding protein n=1 Tax=Pseudonocardia sp. Ae505_Ps2 TaxID=1885034 RepID=UPI00094F14DF|nr:NAD(P)H-binding protein [Pseudonocardia sp. Ae505_Ps2]OLM12776.1 Oxidoreductase [Pseudonocardia sp. Ae505_Ps2]
MYLITGATGTVGSELVPQLVAAGEPVRALTRFPEKADLPEGVEVVGGDLERPESLDGVFTGVDTVFVVPPGYGHEGPVHETNLVAAARAAGVGKLVKLSTSGVEFGATDPLSLGHSSGEDVVRESGMRWTILRPGTFMSFVGQYARSVASDGVVHTTQGDPTSAMVHPRDIASVAYRALLTDDHLGAALPITGGEAISPARMVEVVAEVVGRPVAHVERTPAEARAEYAERGWGGPRLEVLLELKRQSVEWDRTVFDTVERVTGRAPLTLHDWVTENIALFR